MGNFQDYTRKYNVVLEEISQHLSALRKSSPKFDWMLHAGCALYLYKLKLFDLSDIDIIFIGKNTEELVNYLGEKTKKANISIYKGRYFSRGRYNGKCVVIVYKGFVIHLFNPLTATSTVDRKVIKYTFNLDSFKRKVMRDNIPLAPIEDILMYRIILRRSYKDSKHDFEHIAEIILNCNLDKKYLGRIINKSKNYKRFVLDTGIKLPLFLKEKRDLEKIFSRSPSFIPSKEQIKTIKEFLFNLLSKTDENFTPGINVKPS